LTPLPTPEGKKKKKKKRADTVFFLITTTMSKREKIGGLKRTGRVHWREEEGVKKREVGKSAGSSFHILNF